MKRIVVACIFLALAGCAGKTEESETPEQPAVAVSSIQTHAQEVAKSLRVLGKLEAADSVAVYSKVNGKLVDFQVKSGEEVKKGDLIAYVDRDEVGYQYNQAPIYSPISGIISSLPLAQGSEVRLTTAIGYIMNIDHVNALFSLPERYRTTIQVGQPVDVFIDSLGERGYRATISEINPLIDPASHAFTVKVTIENPKKELVPGMFATGNIILETFSEAVLLPEEAVIPIKGEWFVYTISENEALLKKVKLGLRQKGEVHIVEGVEPGEQVIVGGNHKVSDGQKVRVAR